MLRVLRGFAAIALLANAALAQDGNRTVAMKTPLEYEREFAAWMEAHRITFHDALEYAKRLENYIANDLLILTHNAAYHLHGFTLGHNEFSHLSKEEMKAQLFGFEMPRGYLETRRTAQNASLVVQNVEAPESIDWVEKGGVTPIKNQGKCGSCWAFSTTGAVEGATFVASGILPNLSEQELVDCDDNGDMGCDGGLMDHAFQWIEQHGICSENEYTYKGKEAVCRECKQVVKVTGFQDVQPNNEGALKTAVAQQPVSVAVQANLPEFLFYKSGILSSSCGTDLDHGVLIVGYGEENGQKYWKIKNSWGESWGEKGYVRLARDIDDSRGKCGIAMVPSYPFASMIEDSTLSSLSTQQQENPIDSSASISQCGDKDTAIISFDELDITPKAPKRGKPVMFFGKGMVKKSFDSANFKMTVKLGGAQVYTHSGVMCGNTHVPLPLGLGHIDVHGFDCPMKQGKFDGLKVDVNLPVIAPAGNYEIQLTSGGSADSMDDSLFCVHVELQLDNEEQYRHGHVYEFLP